MTKKEKYFFILSLIAVPVIIYFYFLKWKTTTIFGDDLVFFYGIEHSKNFSDAIHISTSGGKYRPIHSLSLKIVYNLFQKNLNYYYLFNVFIQTINTYLVALLINLFLRSRIISILFSLIYGLSRFSFYVICEIFDGGALEGLAVTFFLSSLFFVLAPLIKTDYSKQQVIKSLLWGILFANLSMYVHERYIILFPFIMIVILFYPGLKNLTRKQKISLSSIPLVCILINVAIKKCIYLTPFFVGTAGTNITFSLTSSITYFTDAVLSIFQINTGPDYLVGISFASLSFTEKILTFAFSSCLLIILVVYLFRVKKIFALQQEKQKSAFFVFIALAILFVLSLIPAIVTVRLEQRWLQAPLSVFILMIVIAFSSFQFKNIRVKNVCSFLFIAFFLLCNFNYFNKGVGNLYLLHAEEVSGYFKQAINNGSINPYTTKLYLWEEHMDPNGNNSTYWAIGGGKFFDFYQNKSKEIIFTDSLYHKQGDTMVTSFPNFNKDSAQILYVKYDVTDITDQYLKDSLKSFKY